MAINLNEAVIKIKAAGASKVRVIPMPNERVDNGLYRIEVLQENQWVVLVEGIQQSTANDLVAQAINRTICG